MTAMQLMCSRRISCAIIEFKSAHTNYHENRQVLTPRDGFRLIVVVGLLFEPFLARNRVSVLSILWYDLVICGLLVLLKGHRFFFPVFLCLEKGKVQLHRYEKRVYFSGMK